MNIMLTGIDTGHYTKFAYDYIDSKVIASVGLKGKDVFKYSRVDKDAPVFKPAIERHSLYIVEVNKVKDELAELMELRWDSGNDNVQPNGFMNFPVPSEGKYIYEKYFSHFESEHRIVDYDKSGMGVSIKWEKKSTNSQNHFWDVRIYGMVLKEIIAHLVCREAKIIKPTWVDYVDLMKNVKK